MLTHCWINGASVDLQDQEGTSALTIAIQSQFTQGVLQLLRRGAQMDIQNKKGITPLMVASKLGLHETTNCLIEYNANLDLQDEDGKTALIHAIESRNVDLAIHLIELGANINLQDKKGWFPLMYAARDEDLEAVQLLVAYGADMHLTNSEEQTIFDCCSQEFLGHPLFHELVSLALILSSNLKILCLQFQMFLNTINEDLSEFEHCFIIDFDANFSYIGCETKYPGIIFYGTPMSLTITSSGASFDCLQDMGISISVPKDALSSSEEPLTLSVHACFKGPFRVAKKYRSASPAYLISHSRNIHFQKDITIRMQHYAALSSQDDCEKMVFLSASSMPEYQDSKPVYTFEEMHGAITKTTFTCGEQEGKACLRHFCLVKIAKKKSKDESM